MNKFDLIRPRTLSEAVAALPSQWSEERMRDALPLAGGQDLLTEIKEHLVEPEALVALRGVPGLDTYEWTANGELVIGALTPIVRLERDERIGAELSVLQQAAASIASPQIRTFATVGGNLCQRPRCWYFRGDFDCLRKGGDICSAMAGENHRHALFGAGACLAVHPSDTATALVALGARANIAGRRGTRTIDMESFFVLPDEDMTKENVLQPDELLTDVVVPPPPAGFASAFRKVRTRGAFDFALASLAVGLAVRQGRVEAPRVVLGAAALKPWRAVEAEKILAGARLDATTIALAADAAVRGAVPLEENAYKVPMFRGLVLEVLEGLSRSDRVTE